MTTSKTYGEMFGKMEAGTWGDSMTVKELKEFRQQLVYAKSVVYSDSRSWVPLVDAGLLAPENGGPRLKCSITMLGTPMNAFQFYDWCHSVDLYAVRLMYDRSILAIDAQIAAAQPTEA